VAKPRIIARYSRVAELEQENARLQVLAQKSASHDGNSCELMSEIEQLRARLAAAEQRERELNSQLSNRPAVALKTELSEPRLPASPVRHPAFPAQVKPSSDKTSASLSLLVSLAFASKRGGSCVSMDLLLCAFNRSYSAPFLPYFRFRHLLSLRYQCPVRFLCRIRRSMSILR